MPKEPELEHETDDPEEHAPSDPSEQADEAADSDDEAREARRRARAQREGRPARTKRKLKRRLPKTEREIDSPKPLTLVMLGAMAGATIIMWGSARLACNNRSEVVRKPPELPARDLSRTAKDAAIELQQRWATYNFSGALELAKGALSEQINQEKQRVCSSADACEHKREELSERVLTTGALLSQDQTSAVVRVSTIAPDGTQTYVMKVEPDGPYWKVSERRPADKATGR